MRIRLKFGRGLDWAALGLSPDDEWNLDVEEDDTLEVIKNSLLRLCDGALSFDQLRLRRKGCPEELAEYVDADQACTSTYKPKPCTLLHHGIESSSVLEVDILLSDDTRVAIHRLTQTGAVRVRAAALGKQLRSEEGDEDDDIDLGLGAPPKRQRTGVEGQEFSANGEMQADLKTGHAPAPQQAQVMLCPDRRPVFARYGEGDDESDSDVVILETPCLKATTKLQGQAHQPGERLRERTPQHQEHQQRQQTPVERQLPEEPQEEPQPQEFPGQQEPTEDYQEHYVHPRQLQPAAGQALPRCRGRQEPQNALDQCAQQVPEPRQAQVPQRQPLPTHVVGIAQGVARQQPGAYGTADTDGDRLEDDVPQTAFVRRRTGQPTGSSKRWTVDEVQALADAVEKHGTRWALIERQTNLRDQVSLKDKWRNLAKACKGGWVYLRENLPQSLRNQVEHLLKK